MKKVSKIIKWITLSILILLAIIFISVFIQTKINPDKIPSILGYKPFIVLSGSMETEIYKGDLAIIKTVNKEKLKENDIIAFRDNTNHVVTHRIVEIINKDGSKEFITKGDNNNKNDSDTVKLENIEGKYMFKISKLGNLFLILQKPITLLIILVIIVGSFIISILLGNNKLTDEERKELEQLRKQANK